MSDVDLNAKALITIEQGRRFCFRNEDDAGRDGILIDAINDVSESIWDYCDRELLPTTAATESVNDPGIGGVSLTVVAATGFPASSGFKILVDSEVMLVTAGGGSATWTVTRAQDGTTAAAHAIGSAVYELEARIFSYDGSGVLSLRPYDLHTFVSATMYTDLDTALQETLESFEYRLRPPGRARGGTYLAIGLPVPIRVEPSAGFGWQTTITGRWGMEEVPGAVALACKQWVDNIIRNPGSMASQQQAGYTIVPEIDFNDRRSGMPPAVRHRLEKWRRKENEGLHSVRFGREPIPALPIQRVN